MGSGSVSLLTCNWEASLLGQHPNRYIQSHHWGINWFSKSRVSGLKKFHSKVPTEGSSKKALHWIFASLTFHFKIHRECPWILNKRYAYFLFLSSFVLPPFQSWPWGMWLDWSDNIFFLFLDLRSHRVEDSGTDSGTKWWFFEWF